MIRLALTLLSAALLAGASKPADRLNILVLYADDWRHDTLGCAGHPVLRTPHLDALAKDGFRFTRACVTTSICGVSRATLFTGQWMSRHGNPGFDAWKTPWAETWPGILRDAGYWTGHVGKWHNGKFPAERFDFGRAYAGTHWLKGKDGKPVHVTRQNEADALEFLRGRPKDKPFSLTLAFFATHAEDQNPKQYLPQPESLELYKDAVIPVPRTASEVHLKALPPFLADEKNAGRIRWHWRFDTAEKYQDYMKNYYRLASEVDAACGRIVAELKAQGLLENTLVLFTTDNGYFHGEHGLADKWYPYEESIRVPLIVRDPRMAAERRGGTNDDYVLNADLAPTILSAARAAAPPRMQGTDFAPLYLADRKPAWRDEFYYEHAIVRSKEFIPASEAVVRRDVKYLYWPDYGHEELFDLAADPQEERNLAADPTRVAQKTELKRKLSEWREKVK